MTSKLKCPVCNEPMEELVLYSLPPKFKYECKKCGYNYIKEQSHLISDNSTVQLQEPILNEIRCKIPDGHAITSLEIVSSTNSEDGQGYLRITTKRIDDDK